LGALVVGVLFLRGELSPFLETIRLNIAYSQEGMAGNKKGLASIIEHTRLIGEWRLFDQ
jgi:hypothetical protein